MSNITLNAAKVVRIGDTIFIPLPEDKWEKGIPGCKCGKCDGDGIWDTLAVSAKLPTKNHDCTWLVHMPEHRNVNGSKPKDTNSRLVLVVKANRTNSKQSAEMHGFKVIDVRQLADDRTVLSVVGTHHNAIQWLTESTKNFKPVGSLLHYSDKAEL